MGDSGAWDISPLQPQPVLGTGEQQVPYDNPLWQWTKFFGGVGAIAAIGRASYRGGNIWDQYLKGIRFLEERSPAKILRTFQASTWLSGFGSEGQAARFIPGTQWGQWLTGQGSPLGGYYRELMGLSAAQETALIEQGATFAKGKVFAGQGTAGEVLLEHAGILRTPLMSRGPTRAMESYARGGLGIIPGAYSGEAFFEKVRGGKKIPVPSEFQYLGQGIGSGDLMMREHFILTGGKTKREAAQRMFGGVATDISQRFNRLLWQMTDVAEKYIPGAKRVRKGLERQMPEFLRPFGLGVERMIGPGGRVIETHTKAWKTWGKLGLKLGVGLPLVIGAWNTVDWATRELGTEGINAWVAKSYMLGQIALSTAAEYTGLHAIREWQEEAAPGSTSLTHLAAFPAAGAFMGMTAGYLHKQRIYKQMTEPHKRALDLLQGQARDFRKWSKVEFLSAEHQAQLEKMAIEAEQRAVRFEGRMGHFIERSVKGALGRRDYQGKVMGWAMDKLYSGKYLTGQQPGWLSRQLGKVGDILRAKSPTSLRGWLGAAAGAALVLPFLPGALIPSERPDSLWRQLSGEEDVPIRKGRWWPAGRSSYEGERIMQFRPHWAALTRFKPEEAGVWGDPTSPFMKWFLQNFTYHLEDLHYEDRPYGQSGPAFADVPIFGPLLAGTLGQIVKPAKYYHTDEWTGGGGTLYPAGRQTPSVPGLGGTGPGALRPEGGLTDMLGEQMYRMQEVVGLPGFMLESVKEAVTGRPGWWDQEARLRTAGAMYGGEELRSFWEGQMGDPVGVTEWWRRLYPHKQRQIPRIEPPIRNQMPEWMPGPGERSPDFLHGDPFMKIPMGEALLPGPGLAAIHPELEGVAPEDYPLPWQYYVLARSAPYSTQFKATQREMVRAVKQGQLTEDETAWYEKIRSQVEEQKQGTRFYEERYGRGTESARDMLLESRKRAQRGEGVGLFGRTLGTYWETIGLALETPLEALTPLAPASKLLHMRTSIQAYEREVLYGPKIAMWGSPYSDFIKPFFMQTANAFGWQGIPTAVQEQRGVSEFFDILKYVKYTRLKRVAVEQGNQEAANQYEDLRRTTLTGVNVMGRNLSQLYRSIPSSERDYFRAFSDVTLDEEKNRILQIVPEVEKPLLVGQWHLKYMDALRDSIRNDTLVGMSQAEAEEQIAGIQEAVKTEGFPIDEDLYGEFLSTRIQGENYADWFRRRKIAERVKELGFSMPGPSWIGFLPQVDLDDVAMKYITDEGMDMHDYGLWPDRMLTMPYKSYINEDAVEDFRGTMSKWEVEGRLKSLMTDLDISTAMISMHRGMGNQNEVNVNLEYDVADQLKEMRGQF